MTLVEPDRRPSAPLFADRLRRHGEAVAAITDAGPVTYATLDSQVGELAQRLGGDRRLVLVEVANTVEALVGYLAAMRAGHPVLLAPSGDTTATTGLVGAYDPDVVIRSHHDGHVEERRASTAHDLHPDLALLLSTSGSTGSPKLVRLSRRNLQANAAAITRYLALGGADRAITTLPMHYCYGLSVVNSHLHAGAALVLTDLSVVDRCFWDLFAASAATSLAGVPHTFDLLDRVGFEAMSLPSLRYVTQAGGRMHPDTVRRYARLGERDGWSLFVMYGQTEATARMAYLPPALASSHPRAIGVPIPGGAFTIDAPDADGVGELVYRGANVMLGYAEQPADLALGATVDSLRTGDLARVGPGGLYEIVGRRSRFIKPFGLRVDLDRVDAMLDESGLVGACTGDDERLVVAVEGTDDIDAVARLLTRRLAVPATLVQVLPVAEVPRLASGKADYQALLRLAADRRTARAPDGSERQAVVADGDPQAAVRDVFRDVLGREPSGDDSFVSLGGDSLSYVEASIRLEAVLGSLPRHWHTARVADLVPAASTRRSVAAVDTATVLRAVAIVLVVATHAGLWHVPGGAHTLVAVAGYNFARFRPRPAAMLASAARVAVPSAGWITAVAALSDRYGWPNALLVNGFVGRTGDGWGYWFVEAQAQILVALAACFAIPTVARLARRRPFTLAVVAVAAGLVVRFDLVEVTTTHRIARPHEVFWLFALGWAAAAATSVGQRLVVLSLAAVAVPGFFGDTQRELVVLAGISLVLWRPTLPVPRAARKLVALVAGGSLYIYLTHFQIYPPLARLHGPAVAVAGSVLAGVVIWLLTRRVVARGERSLRALACRAGVAVGLVGNRHRVAVGWPPGGAPCTAAQRSSSS